MTTFTKDPVAVLDYQFDWAAWLATDGDTIASHTITADSGITVDSSSATVDTVTVWLSGGSEGVTYTVDCEITTAAGRTDSRKMSVTVTDR